MSEPPRHYSRQELDSILSEKGAMPAANMGIRLRAFFLDWIFVSIFIFMLTSFVTPRLFPEASSEYALWFKDVIEWFEQSGFQKGVPLPDWNETLANAILYIQFLSLIAFWVYFSVSEAFFSGYTFGKSICRLRTISSVTLKKPLFLSIIFRSAIKSLALLSPLVLLATTIALKFNKRHQMGHDLICRTAVIDERYLSSVDQI